MALFDFFRRQKNSENLPDQIGNTSVTPTSDELDVKEVFQRADLLAEWAAAHFLGGVSIEDDYGLLPDADVRENLEITVEQRDRCLGEYSVLRVAGVSLVVKQHYEDRFWLMFNDRIVQALNKHLDRFPGNFSHFETRLAVEEYVSLGEKSNSDAISAAYLRRVYDDSPNYIRMKVSGIGEIGTGTLLDTHEIFLDAYCQANHGLPYNALQKLHLNEGEA